MLLPFTDKNDLEMPFFLIFKENTLKKKVNGFFLLPKSFLFPSSSPLRVVFLCLTIKVKVQR